MGAFCGNLQQRDEPYQLVEVEGYCSPEYELLAQALDDLANQIATISSAVSQVPRDEGSASGQASSLLNSASLHRSVFFCKFEVQLAAGVIWSEFRFCFGLAA
jgi:hypothetical protein